MFEINVANTLAEAIATAEVRAETRAEQRGINLVREEIEAFLDDRDRAALAVAIADARKEAAKAVVTGSTVPRS